MEEKINMTLTEIWEKYKSDKGTVHSYIPYYEKVLQDYKNTENGVLEIRKDGKFKQIRDGI